MKRLLTSALALCMAVVLCALPTRADVDAKNAELLKYAPEAGGEIHGEYLGKFERVTNTPSWTLERLTYANVENRVAERDGLTFKASVYRSKEWRSTAADTPSRR